jgi:hypothetical protein
MSRNEIGSSQTNAMHQRVAVSGGALGRVRTGACSDVRPGNSGSGGTALCSADRVSRRFHAVHKRPPIGNTGCGDTWVVLNCASFVHISDTLVLAMLACKYPRAPNLNLVGIAIRVHGEVHDRSDSG